MSYIKDYRYFAPNQDEVINILTKFMTREDAVATWETVCRSADLNPSQPKHTLSDLKRVADKLIDNEDSILSIAGNSLKIRLLTYEKISENIKDTEESVKHWKSLIADRNRLNEIKRLDLFSDDVRDLLDSTTQEICDRLKLPVSLVSIVLDESQYFASHKGLENSWMGKVSGTPIEWSFCKNLIADKKDLIIEDARKDERVKDIPLIEQDKVVCYAGSPLVTSNGYCIGSLCVIGPEGRQFEESEIQLLRTRAREVMQKLEDRVSDRN